MYNLDELTVLNDLRARLGAITPELIDAHARRSLTAVEKNEKVVGVIDSDLLRALYTVGQVLRHESMRLAVDAETSLEPELAEEHAQHARILDELNDAAGEIFWAQVKTDLGLWQNLKGKTLGLREGWTIVQFGREASVEAKMFKFPLPRDLFGEEE